MNNKSIQISPDGIISAAYAKKKADCYFSDGCYEQDIKKELTYVSEKVSEVSEGGGYNILVSLSKKTQPEVLKRLKLLGYTYKAMPDSETCFDLSWE